MNALIKQAAPPWLVRFGIAVKQLNYTRAPMPEGVRERLIDVYRSDIKALESLLQRDLTHWIDG